MTAPKLQFAKVEDSMRKSLFNKLMREKVEIRLWRPSDGEQKFKVIHRIDEEKELIFFSLKDSQKWLGQKISLFIKDEEKEYLSSGKPQGDSEGPDIVGIPSGKLFLVDNRIDPRLPDGWGPEPVLVMGEEGPYRFKCKNISSTGAGIKVMKALVSLFEKGKGLSHITLLFNEKRILIPEAQVMHVTKQQNGSFLVGLKFKGLEENVVADLSNRIRHLIAEKL
jgi:hypothetical protein